MLKKVHPTPAPTRPSARHEAPAVVRVPNAPALSLPNSPQRERASATSSVAAEIGAEPFINKREAARRLGNTTRTVENMMRRGLIPYYKLGCRVAFRWSEIQSHLAQNCRICR